MQIFANTFLKFFLKFSHLKICLAYCFEFKIESTEDWKTALLKWEAPKLGAASICDVQFI